jgi:WD40 repeat protein
MSVGQRIRKYFVAFWSRVERVLTAPLRFFVSHDVFISYARKDGAGYAEALANHLADEKRRFISFLDQWEATPGKRIPPKIRRAARWSRGNIIVASEAALKSSSIDTEICEFLVMPGPIVLVTFPQNPITDAIWYHRLAGLSPVVEPGGVEALQNGSPSTNVLNRAENALTFWRRNRRIKAGALGGIAIFCLSLVVSVVLGIAANNASKRAGELMRQAEAIEFASRAEDLLANGGIQYSAEATRIGLKSLSVKPTAWGESVVRKGIILMPNFLTSFTTDYPELYVEKPPGQVAPVEISPRGILAKWSYDKSRSDNESRSKNARILLYRVDLLDSSSGLPIRPTVDIRGFIRKVHFNHDSHGLIVCFDRSEVENDIALLWISITGSETKELPEKGLKAYAISSSDNMIATFTERLELWTCATIPEKSRSWELSGIRALSFSPYNKFIFFVRENRLERIDLHDSDKSPEYLCDLGKVVDPKVLTTEGHVVLVTESRVRTWRLKTQKWTHDFKCHTDASIIVVPNEDRLIIAEPSKVILWDIWMYPYPNLIEIDAENDGSRQFRILDYALSGDARTIAIANGNGVVTVYSTRDGTRLAAAPLYDDIPMSVGLDGIGKKLFVYSTRYRASIDKSESRVSTWEIVNYTTDRIGREDLPRRPFGFSLADDGKLLAVVSNSSNQKSVLRVYDPLTGNELARAESELNGFNSKISANSESNRIVTAWTDLDIWKIYPPRIIREAHFNGVQYAINVGLGGQNGSIVAVSSSNRNSGQVLIYHRIGGNWKAEQPVRCGIWTMAASPDPIAISPIAVNAVGKIAYLAVPETGHNEQLQIANSRVELRDLSGRVMTLDHDAAVTDLLFADVDTLIVATRSGNVWAWSMDGSYPVGRIVGKHENAVRNLASSDEGRVISVDHFNTVRMWDLHTPKEKFGLRGIMEFPQNTTGISDFSYFGHKGLSLQGDKLIIITQHARGLFLDVWKIPNSKELVTVAKIRLGNHTL